jgi:hypothetical protein
MIAAELRERRGALTLLIATTVIGAALAAAGLWRVAPEIGLALTRETVYGVVVSLKPARNGIGVDESLVVYYDFTPRGTAKPLRGEQRIRREALGDLRPGQPVEIMYLPALPRYNRTTVSSGPGTLVQSALLISGGLALSIPGIVTLSRAARSHQRV